MPIHPSALVLLAALSAAASSPRLDLIALVDADTARPDGKGMPPVATSRIGSLEQQDAFLLVDGRVQARSVSEITPTEVEKAEDLAGFEDSYARLKKALGKETATSTDTLMPSGGNLFALRTRRTWTWERPEGRLELIAHRTEFLEKPARTMARAMIKAMARQQPGKVAKEDSAVQMSLAMAMFRQDQSFGTRLEVRAWNALSDSSFARALSRCGADCLTDSLWNLYASEGSFELRSSEAPDLWFAFQADSRETYQEKTSQLGKEISLSADRRTRQLPHGTLVLEQVHPNPGLATAALAEMRRQAKDQDFGLGPKSPEIAQVRKSLEEIMAKMVPGFVRTLFATRRLAVTFPAPTEPEADLGAVSE